MTIGNAFYYSLRHATSDYILFLEKDFKADLDLSLQVVKG